MVDIIGEAAAEVAGALVRHAGGLVVELSAEHIFSRHTARFFHGVGRRVIFVGSLGAKRIPSSLRKVPKAVRAGPRRSDWLALWTGVGSWIALFLLVGIAITHFL